MIKQVMGPILGYVMAVSAHAIWNSSTLYGADRFLTVYVALMAPAFLMVLAAAVWWRRSERKMLYSALHDAAMRGFLPPTDISFLTDLRARRHARDYAKQVGGLSGGQAMKEYQQMAIELGFLHHRYLRGTPPADFAVRGQEFVNRMHAIRPSIQFPPVLASGRSR
jgi:protease PrsW